MPRDPVDADRLHPLSRKLPGWLTPHADRSKRLWFVRDHLAMAQALAWAEPQRVAPFYIDLESPAPPGGVPKPGPLQVNLKNDHLQYAVTWFLLAAAVTIAFGFWARAAPRAAGLAASRVLVDARIFGHIVRRSAPPARIVIFPLYIKVLSCIGRALEDRPVRYISTRGEAPALGFCDVMLAGLARDGGLYVPETWPQLDAADDRRLLRPALRRGRGRGDPPLRRRRDLRRRPRAHGERGLRHLPPSGGGAARPGLAEPVHPRAVPRADARLQGRGDAAAVAADGPRAGQARRAHHHRRRDLRRHRRRRGRGVRRPRQCRPVRAVSRRPHFRRAAADDDHGGRGQRACARGRGHLRRLPGAGEGAVQPPPLPRQRRRSPASTRSTGRASSRRRSTTSPRPSRSARRRAASTSPCRPAISATSSRAMSPSAWACRSAGCASRPTSTTSSRARLPAAPTRCARCTRPPRRRWTSRSSSNFERLVFEATGRDSAAVRGLMASLAQSGRFVLPAAALRSIREQFDAGRADEDEVNAAIRAAWRESGDLIDPHTAVAIAVSEHATATPNVPNIVLSTAHRGEIPRRGRGRLRRAAGAAGLSRRADDEAGEDHARCRTIAPSSSVSSARPAARRRKRLKFESSA